MNEAWAVQLCYFNKAFPNSFAFTNNVIWKIFAKRADAIKMCNELNKKKAINAKPTKHCGTGSVFAYVRDIEDEEYAFYYVRRIEIN